MPSPSEPPAPVLVKVCGLTSVAEAIACASAGVDWIGLNFHPSSPRHVDAATAKAIVAALPDSCQAIGLFVDRPPEEVANIAREVGLRLVQLHGQEPPSDLFGLRLLAVVRAFRLGSLEAVDHMREWLAEADSLGAPPLAALVDAYVPGQPGGTGHAIAREILAALPPLPRLILAGGLNPRNVTELVASVRPWMVDVSSGVESVPGRKDPRLVEAFVQAARAAIG